MISVLEDKLIHLRHTYNRLEEYISQLKELNKQELNCKDFDIDIYENNKHNLEVMISYSNKIYELILECNNLLYLSENNDEEIQLFIQKINDIAKELNNDILQILLNFMK